MKILGIYDGHLSTASLLIDGRIVAIMSEERLTRKKNQGGAPLGAIRWVLDYAGLKGGDIDAVALAMLTEPLYSWDEDIHQTRRQVFRAANLLLPRAVIGSSALVKPYVAIYKHRRDWAGLNAALEAAGISPRLYTDCRFEHHACHAATAYFLAPFYDPGEPTLIVTADGSGDGLCASVNIGHKGTLERVQATP